MIKIVTLLLIVMSFTAIAEYPPEELPPEPESSVETKKNKD